MKELKNRYFLLRHGQTTHQIDNPGIIYHWPDGNPPYALTELGRKQIKKHLPRLKKENIDLILASDALRTKQTAEIVAQELGLKVELDQRLRDTNWGVLQGKTKQEGWEFYGHDKKKRFEITPPGGESWQDMEKRVKEFLEELEKNHNQKNILIVSHGDPLWVIDSLLKGLSREQSFNNRKEGCPMRMGELKKIS